MGYTSAVDMLSQSDFDTALRWHLEGNLFPPPPSYMFAPCKKAIEECRTGGYYAEVPLPEGVRA